MYVYVFVRVCNSVFGYVCMDNCVCVCVWRVMCNL